MDRLAEEIPAALLQEWMLFLKIEPQGAWADDWRWSGLMSLIANQNRGKGKPAVEQRKFALMREERPAATNLFQKIKAWALDQQAAAQAKPPKDS